MSSFDVVVAADEAGGIGAGGTLPWRLPSELRHFAALTRDTAAPGRQNAVVMGRRTWESLPPRFRPLPGRLNVVLSRGDAPEGAEVARDLDAALALAWARADRVFVIGGGQVYAAALAHPACRDVYLTRVAGRFSCDTFLPELAPRFFRAETVAEGADDGLGYRIERWQRADT